MAAKDRLRKERRMIAGAPVVVLDHTSSEHCWIRGTENPSACSSANVGSSSGKMSDRLAAARLRPRYGHGFPRHQCDGRPLCCTRASVELVTAPLAVRAAGRSPFSPNADKHFGKSGSGDVKKGAATICCANEVLSTSRKNSRSWEVSLINQWRRCQQPCEPPPIERRSQRSFSGVPPQVSLNWRPW